MTHFVSASCDGNLCSVCKAPATHKLGEEIPPDEPVTPCPDCNRTWRMLDAAVQADKPWRWQCAHCGHSHPYTSDEDDVDACPACDAEASPIHFRNCGNITHSIFGPARHNLTAYVCCAHFTMILGSATGCPSETSGVGNVAQKVMRLGACQLPTFKDAVKISERALEIHGHGAAHSQLAMVVFDLAELVAAIARGDK